MLKKERAASRAICDAATKGPWGTLPSSPHPKVVKQSDYNDTIAQVAGSEDYGSNKYHQALADAKFCAHARTALPVALDALDEMEKQISYLEGLLTVVKSCRGNEQQGWEKTAADRDQWKARAEALETYVKSLWNDGGCQACVHNETRTFGKPCDDCGFDMHNWQFDQERFGKGQSNE